MPGKPAPGSRRPNPGASDGWSFILSVLRSVVVMARNGLLTARRRLQSRNKIGLL
jgi:hypothetical protein